ncbi:MAG: phosphatidylglycerol lysyltransferase domain-containing protein [Lachnospiraceae bacterium]|jgi:hypothetical protein|nr:phosphatidylglycerol lysyltransferase domain-containing protein [Lachnospiraceae bacterium]
MLPQEKKGKLDFQPLALSHQAMIDQYSLKFGENSCQHSFVSMFCFNVKYGYSVCESDGWLFVCRENLCNEEYRVYFMPMGTGDLALALLRLQEDAHCYGAKVKLETVTESMMNRVMKVAPGMFLAKDLRDYAEYIYSADKLAHLAGNEMASKRHDVNSFWRDYVNRVVIKEMTSDTAKEALVYQRYWLKTRLEQEDSVQLELENEAILLGLQHFDQLKLSGILLYVDDVLRGYAYGAKLSDDCYDVIIEKGDREIDNIYRILNLELIQRCCGGYTMINREEDLGVPGLRKAKLSYKPDILLKKYRLTEVTV